MKQKTYWWMRDKAMYGHYRLCRGTMPTLDKSTECWEREQYNEGFVLTLYQSFVDEFIPSAKLKPGECIEITGFKIIKKKRK